MFSCQFCEISKNTFFTEHLLATASKAVSLDVNDVCFEEEQDIPNTHEKSRKCQSVLEWCRCGKWGVTVMYTNVE